MSEMPAEMPTTKTTTAQQLRDQLEAAYRLREQECMTAIQAALADWVCVLDIRVTESSLTGRREYLMVPVAKERTGQA